MKPRKSPKAKLPALLNLRAIEARKQAMDARMRDEAKDAFVRDSLSYMAVFTTCGMAVERDYAPPIGPEEEDRRLTNMINSGSYYLSLLHPTPV